jgi:hypothetical protein
MGDRNSFGKKVSDSFLPKDIKELLFRPLIKLGPADINGWNFMHMFSGILIASFGFDFWQAFFIHLVWEIFQATVGDNKLDSETLLDVPLDTLFFLFGYCFYLAL